MGKIMTKFGAKIINIGITIFTIGMYIALIEFIFVTCGQILGTAVLLLVIGLNIKFKAKKKEIEP